MINQNMFQSRPRSIDRLEDQLMSNSQLEMSIQLSFNGDQSELINVDPSPVFNTALVVPISVPFHTCSTWVNR